MKSENPTPGPIAAVDLGGTKILATVLDERYRKLGKRKVRTNAAEGSESVVDAIAEAVRDACTDSGYSVDSLGGVGVVVPGVFDRTTGKIHQTPNLPLSDVAMGPELEKRLGVRVILENDVNAGTYGEFRAGAAEGFRHVLGVFPGTGIGGGLIFDGRLYTGATGNAGEIGHMILQTGGALCGCGNRGCLEALASRSAMAKDAVFLASSGAAPATFRKYGTDFTKYTSKVFLRAVEAGESSIVGVIERAAWYLGVGIANCVNLLSPEIVVIGGGLVERLGTGYIEMIKRSMMEHAMVGLGESVSIVPAALGDDAAIIGAAALVAESVVDE